MLDNLENIFVTVIIPVYNDQNGLSACLDALNAQTWPKDRLEVIVVDNNSSSPIRLYQVFSDFARIVLCRTPGSYAARNVGVAASHGKILAFTDADCRPDPNWIEAGVRALLHEKESCIVGGEVSFIKSERLTSVEQYQHLVGFQQFENIEKLGFTVTANLFVSRSQFQRIGPFNEKLLSGGDREWSWRAAKVGFAVKYAPDAIVRTSARNSILAAIRQARRVEGGRYTLRRIHLNFLPSSGLKPYRSAMESSLWILKHPELSSADRIKVFMIASLIKISRTVESIRLSFGTTPERN